MWWLGRGREFENYLLRSEHGLFDTLGWLFWPRAGSIFVQATLSKSIHHSRGWYRVSAVVFRVFCLVGGWIYRGEKNIARLDPDRDGKSKVLLEGLAKLLRPSLAFSFFRSSLPPGTHDRNLDILPEGLWNVVLSRTFQVSFTLSSAIYLIVLSRKP